jgi:hypothetical protein
LTVAELSREEARRLLVELADLQGYYPASLAPDDVAGYRKEAPERPIDTPRRANRWNPHPKEEKRRREAEERDRAEVVDLYE